MKVNPKFKEKIKFNLIIGSGVLVTIMTVYLASNVSKNRQGLTGMAGTESKKVNLFLYPSTVSQSEKSSFNIAPKLVGPEDKKISSILLSMSFDPSHITLTNLPSEAPDAPISVLKATSIEEANKAGKIMIFLGAESEEKAPLRVVNIPSLTFTIQKRSLSSISIQVSGSQVVFSNQDEAEIQVSSDVTVNSQVDPTATPDISVTSIPTPTITLAPTVTIPASTSVPGITGIVVPTATESAIQITP